MATVLLKERFRINLRSAMTAARITQTQLADRMGVKQQQVSKYLVEDHCPGLDLVDAFATALGVEPEAILKMPEEFQNQKKNRRRLD